MYPLALPLVSLPLQGLARYLPLLAGGATVASQTDPKGLEYLKEGLSSLINPASYSLNPLEDILESKIIKFPEKNKGSEDNQTPNKDPDQDPEIPPSGIGEVLDLMEEKKSKEKKGTSLFSDTYYGKLMESVYNLSRATGYDLRDSLGSVMNTSIEELEETLANADDYLIKPNKILNLDQIKTLYDEKSGKKFTEEEIFSNKRFKEVLKMAQGDPDIDYREQDKKRGYYLKEAPQGNTFWTTGGFPGDSMNRAKSIIIHIKPGDYLKLAEERKDEFKPTSFELYKNTNVGISVPKLIMSETDNGIFKVSAHEGRHRAKYFEGLDPDTAIPVQVQLNNPGDDEYVDYTRGYYTHGQSVLNAGRKLQESSFVINQDGKSVSIDVLGYEGDGEKVGDVDNPELKER